MFVRSTKFSFMFSMNLLIFMKGGNHRLQYLMLHYPQGIMFVNNAKRTMINLC